jgi:hypothetical protein
MKKTVIYFFSILLIILLFISFNCTENGVECNLVGGWELIDYETNNDNHYDDVEGTLIIYSNDTYDYDVKIKFKNGEKSKRYDTGTLKACSVNKYIQFFSDKDSKYDGNAKYKLDANILVLEDDQHDKTATLQKIY